MRLPLLQAISAACLLAASTASPTADGEPTARSSPVNYDGYHVYRVTPVDRSEARALEKRFAHHHTEHIRNAIEVAIPPHEVRSFNELGLNARLLSDDLGRQIRRADKPPTYDASLHKRGRLPSLSWFDSYHLYEDHLQYWDDLVAAFPHNHEKFEVGKTYEGRTLYAFHLFGDEGHKGKKPIILWHGTVHAREWITTMVVEYLAYQLIDGYNCRDKKVTKWLNYYDFWIVPFHNADGFSYTQTDDRMWRKNRQPRQNTTCIGTDLNRNWKFEWGGEPGTGAASTDPCSDTFQGSAPGDTLENHALDSLSARLVASSPHGIRSFIDWHSYGQKILTPPGWTCNTSLYPPTLPRMLEVGAGVAAAIQGRDSRNETYRYGAGCDVEYYSAGNSRDHMYGVYAADHSWTLELDPETSDEGGFVLPPDQIWPVIKEQWAGQKWLLDDVWKN